MPGLDRTGPMGEGPRTGRGLGLSGRPTGRTAGPLSRFFAGLGLRRRRGQSGRRRGRGGWWGADLFFGGSLTSEQEAKQLTADIVAVREELATMEARLRDLQAKEQTRRR